MSVYSPASKDLPLPAEFVRVCVRWSKLSVMLPGLVSIDIYNQRQLGFSAGMLP